MTAVNLIPHERRSGRFSMSTGPQTLGLFAGLLVVLVAALLYVSAANKVAAHRSELARVTASAGAWKTVASAYVPYETLSQQRAVQLDTVRQLATARFPWPSVLDQIARLLPSDAALSSLSASPATGTGTGTSTAASTATSTSAAPSFELSGCATSQSAVAQTIQQLRGVDGGSTVTLSSSAGTAGTTAASGSSSSATSAGGGSGCGYPVQFQMSLTPTGSSAPAAQTSTTTTTAAQ